MVILQNGARPYMGAELVLGQTDATSFQIFRLVNSVLANID